MARTKPDKIREETYDMIVESFLKTRNVSPLGRTNEGLVYENHLDGEHVVIKVIKKKNEVLEEDLNPITTYVDKIAEYEKEKEENKALKEGPGN